MSGYAYKTPYDATKKRKEYLQELELRAKLDDVNLQANKIYKRTGAVSTPPDTRTTTEKLSDLYRLRIEVRSKLGQIMSGDDAQKVVNELDQQELIFLSQRIDKFIADLKPKYALGVPYQVFNTYFKNAIKSYNSIGDIDMTSLTLLENMPTKDDLDNALFQVERLLTTAGQSQERRMLSGFMMMYSKLMTEIQNNRNLINSGAIVDPAIQQAILDLNSAVAQNLPTGTELKQLEADIQQLETGIANKKLVYEIRKRLAQYDALIGTIENNIADVERQRERILRPKTSLPTSSTKVVKNVEGTTYLDPSQIDPKLMSITELKRYMVISKKIAQEQGRDGELKRLKLNAPTNFKDKNSIISKLQEQEVDDFMKEIWSETISVPSQYEQIPRVNILGGAQAFTNVRLRPPKPTAPTIDPTLGANLNQQQGSGAPNLTGTNPTPQPQPPSPPPQSTPKGQSIPINFKLISIVDAEIQDLLDEIEGYSFTDTTYENEVYVKLTGTSKIKYSLSDIMEDLIEKYVNDNRQTIGTITNVRNLVIGYIKKVIEDLNNQVVPPSMDEFGSSKPSGGSLRGKKSRMKGKGVAIDLDAGMIANGERKSNYVPFGKFIINRNKLNDGIIMIKRPNGAFMGELQSRRVGSKLRNIFEKIVGGSVPSYNDYNKLDADEIEYLHFVAKKSNLLDKLDVPTPKKDDDEKMMNRFEVLRGQLMAGNDNKQMISEFKKLILDMADKKLLPRRQVSDILIDIERMY